MQQNPKQIALEVALGEEESRTVEPGRRFPLPQRWMPGRFNWSAREVIPEAAKSSLPGARGMAIVVPERPELGGLHHRYERVA